MPGGTHGDTVGHADGVKPVADHVLGLDALLDLRGEVHEVHVAGVTLPPNRGDADLGLVHVLGLEAGGVEHRLRD